MFLPRLTFAEAQELYLNAPVIDERQEPDLSPAAEKRTMCICKRRIWDGSRLRDRLMTSKRPFYAFPKPEQPDLTNTFDLLCAGTEITSGGQRRHTFDSMVEGIRMKGMDPANFPD
jgi:nondiscriminating aspartyl-tRNA synthetase